MTSLSLCIGIGSPSKSWTVEVDNVGPDDAARHALARKIYEWLAARTDWDLILDSDNAEDVVATRIRARKVKPT
jgi:hypothetical protein